MHSLCLMLVLLPVSFLVDALALWVGARLVHSTHATWRRALLLQLILMIAALAALLAMGRVFPVSDIPAVMATQTFVAIAAELAAVWLLIRRYFALSAGKTTVVFGLRLALTAVEFCLVILIVRPFLLEAFVQNGNSMSPTIAGMHRQIPCSSCGGNVIVPLVQRRGGRPGAVDLVPGKVGICSRCRLVTSVSAAVGPNRGPDRFCVYKPLRVRRWDVVTYHTADGILASRLVGLPGETVHIAGGDLFIDGQKLPVPAQLAGQTYTTPALAPSAYGTVTNPCTLGPDEYFLLGDLSMLANDSRYRGPVNADAIIGVADLRYWPLARFAVLR